MTDKKDELDKYLNKNDLSFIVTKKSKYIDDLKNPMKKDKKKRKKNGSVGKSGSSK